MSGFDFISVYNCRPMRISASAPTRIDLAGGTIDIWPLYLFHDGATTLNAAISLRSQVVVDPHEGEGVQLRSVDTGGEINASHWSRLDPSGPLPLLTRAARHYRIGGVTVTTRAESPAGAGIAGSSALTIALCGALARFTGRSLNPDDLLQIAMNIECQTIRVPTGVQDYRPAMYGGVAAIELRTEGIKRVPISVDRREIEERIVLAYTGAPRQSGTNNWEITKRHLDGDRAIFDAFERIRDTAVAMRTALERGEWDEVGRQIAAEWDNRKRLAPGVTTPTIEDLIARASAAGATAAKVCGAGGGGCLFCYGPPPARAAIAAALAGGGAKVLDYRIETDGLQLG
jgi:D-glycero-alpha-D-manno-heptose-7-phosphate kinase